jgi:hypothetical protein
MFRFDHDASQQGVGGRRTGSGRPNHRSDHHRMNASRHRRFTGPAKAGYAGGLRLCAQEPDE